MSKWALFAAHRCMWGGASAPREVGPNGQQLLRPWRIKSPDALRHARHHRATRAQPWWPRAVGILLLAIAGLAALHPVEPIPRHVAASSSAQPGPTLVHLVGASPIGALSGGPAHFTWQLPGLVPPFCLVLLDAGYEELVVVDGIGDSSWPCDANMSAALLGGETFHWFVSAVENGHVRRSPLISFDIR